MVSKLNSSTLVFSSSSPHPRQVTLRKCEFDPLVVVLRCWQGGLCVEVPSGIASYRCGRRRSGRRGGRSGRGGHGRSGVAV